MKTLSGRSALVTDGLMGQGFAIAQALAARSVNVAVGSYIGASKGRSGGAAACAEFAEEKKGKLLPGMFADVVVLNGDIEATPADQMSTLKPVLTICDGRVTFER